MVLGSAPSRDAAFVYPQAVAMRPPPRVHTNKCNRRGAPFPSICVPAAERKTSALFALVRIFRFLEPEPENL